MMVSNGHVWRYVSELLAANRRINCSWLLIGVFLYQWISGSVTVPVIEPRVNDSLLSIPDQLMAISIKEELMKLKGPDSYLPDERECILGQASFYLAHWLMANATINGANPELQGKYIDLSYQSSKRNQIVIMMLTSTKTGAVYVSLAHRNMTSVPYEELQMINTTLRYLSMAGNYFYNIRLPRLGKLKVLDLRNCALVHLDYEVFTSVPNLQQLYLSHNYLLQLTADHMKPLALLRHLDLAYNSNGQQAYHSYTDHEEAPDPYNSLTEGLELSEDVFDPLERLIFLDLSHTKLLATSARAFRDLAVEQLSLCYTGISIIVGSMMYGTLRTLDISGNPGITAAIHRDMDAGVRGLNGNIEILACENASVKYLDWVHGMANLRVLLLSYNNINQLTNETFTTLERLEMLDLNANHISNWHWRIFAHNPALTVLDLSANNLNVLTIEMLNDFENVRFLAIGQNNFLCHCLLRDFIDMANLSSNGIGCAIRTMGQHFLRVYNGTTTRNRGQEMQSAHEATYIDDTTAAMSNFIIKTRRSLSGRWNSSQGRLGTFQLLNCSNNVDDSDDEVTGLIQLIDFSVESYTCRDLENVEHDFNDQERCTFDRSALGGLLINGINDTASSIVKFVLIFFGFALIAFIIYISKWEHVKYFCIIVRNATVLSMMRQKKDTLVSRGPNGNRRQSSIGVADGFLYDVFVSYSEHDRSWVLDELLPNLERSEDISVCLHERDFKVGVSILENIIHCMDQSRTLLLVMSEHFLLSHWCQFEMHLAQHRLLETRREHLILVLLEEIPKIKRPKTLHYLMKTKTYIRWPTEANDRGTKSDQTIRSQRTWKYIPFFGRRKESGKPSSGQSTAQGSRSVLAVERKLFWLRLKKSIHDGINWEPDDEDRTSSRA